MDFRNGVAAFLTMILLAGCFNDESSDAGLSVRIGVYENEPKIFTNADSGQPDGLFIDILEAIAAEENWSLTYVHCVWAQCLDMLERGELDIMPDVAWSTERAQRFEFHQIPVARAWSQIYAPRARSVYSIEDLDGLTIAVLPGSVQASYLESLADEQGLDLHLLGSNSFDDSFRAVEQGDADVAVANNFFGSRHRGAYGLLETPITFDQVGLFYAAPRGAAQEPLNTIDAYLDRWLAESSSPYYTALNRAVSMPESVSTPLWVWVLAPGLSALALLLGYASYMLARRVKARTAELKEANRRFAHLLNGSPAVVYARTLDQLEPYWVSSNVAHLFGFDPEDIMQPNWWYDHLHIEDRDVAIFDRNRVLRNLHVRREYRLYDGYGRVRQIRDEQQLVTAQDGQQEVIGTWVDLTDSYEQQARLNYLTHYDYLTGLPNRTLLVDRISQAIRRGHLDGNSTRVVLIDLDRFKNVNDARGSRTGDELLKALAERLRALRPEDTLARMGADEFVLLPGCPMDDNQMKSLALGLLAEVRRPIVLAGEPVVMTASIGVSKAPEHAQDGDSLLTTAELAMFHVKNLGGNDWSAYNPEFKIRTQKAFRMETSLRRAIAKGELRVHYQPQFYLEDGTLTGVEALVRWEHPEFGMIPPNQFIPLAEDIGLIYDLDGWVLNEACRQLKAWEEQGLYVPHLSVNIAAVELEHAGLIERTQKALDEWGLAPSRLVLELTESMLMRVPERSIALLNGLHKLGVRIAIDDFGTGYSNLLYLRSLPLNILKIDQSFVRDIGTSSINESITSAIIAMAQAMELDLVAEGIEHEKHRTFLMQVGCKIGQGFLLARPMRPEQLLADYTSALTNQ